MRSQSSCGSSNFARPLMLFQEVGPMITVRCGFEVENHHQPVGQGVFDRPIEHVEPGGTDLMAGP